MFEYEGKDERIESMLLVIAVLNVALAFHSPSFLSAHLPVLFQHAHSVSLIVTLSVLITHPRAHCLGCREVTEATFSFEENIAQKHISVKRKLNVCHYKDFKKYSPLCYSSCATNEFLIKLFHIICLISAQKMLCLCNGYSIIYKKYFLITKKLILYNWYNKSIQRDHSVSLENNVQLFIPLMTLHL